MKKGTQIRRCPACRVHTASFIPTEKRDAFLGPVYKMEIKECCHKPVGESFYKSRYDPMPREKFPLPGYYCETCYQRIRRESKERADAARGILK